MHPHAVQFESLVRELHDLHGEEPSSFAPVTSKDEWSKVGANQDASLWARIDMDSPTGSYIIGWPYEPDLLLRLRNAAQTGIRPTASYYWRKEGDPPCDIRFRFSITPFGPLSPANRRKRCRDLLESCIPAQYGRSPKPRLIHLPAWEREWIKVAESTTHSLWLSTFRLPVESTYVNMWEPAIREGLRILVEEEESRWFHRGNVVFEFAEGIHDPPEDVEKRIACHSARSL